MESYHGTSSSIALSLFTGTVNVKRGGGELGEGFYTGQHLYLAKVWAFHTTGSKQENVVSFDTDDDDVAALDLIVLSYGGAARKRHHLKMTSQTRTYRFGADMVWAPIVGSERVRGDQYKWESQRAEMLLNGPACMRIVI